MYLYYVFFYSGGCYANSLLQADELLLFALLNRLEALHLFIHFT